MYRFVVRMALRKHVPLRTCVENLQDSFKYTPGWDWFTTRTTISNLPFRKVLPDMFPLIVREPNHPTFMADRLRPESVSQLIVLSASDQRGEGLYQF